MASGYTGLVIGFHVQRGWFNRLHIYFCETYDAYTRSGEPYTTSKWYKAKTIKHKNRFPISFS